MTMNLPLVVVVGDAEVRREACPALFGQGFTLVETGTQAQALSLVERFRPRLVVVALGKTGDPEAALAPWQKVDAPLLALVPDPSRELMERALRVGARDVLALPLDTVALVRSVRRELRENVTPDSTPDWRMDRRLRLLLPLPCIKGGWLIDLSERGLGLETTCPMERLTLITIQAGLWQEIDITAPNGCVMHCQPLNGGRNRYRLGVRMLGQDRAALLRLRHWLREQLADAESDDGG